MQQPMGSTAMDGIRKRLLSILADTITRQEFFSELAKLLRPLFHFDRLCINLYDNQDGMLFYFTNAQGVMLRTLSPIRPAEENTTVAGLVISSQRPVIIPDLSKHFAETGRHPMEEAGLKATIGVPLLIGRELIGTLHCSFAEAPPNMGEIALFLVQVSQVVSPCLSAIIGMELRKAVPQLPALPQSEESEAIIHKSRIMKNVIRNAEGVAKYIVPVMLVGETGTGKTMLAHYIHQRSPRKDAHFVKVNCPALSPSLFESELFGHAKGAFTGAYVKRIGRLEFAHHGTLFLDEIGDLSLEMQSKLLQVLEDSRFERVGESTSLTVDVRLISATNAFIDETLAAKKMRADLYHRLSTHLIEIPPLRHRKEDIPIYIKTFSAEASATLGLKPESLTAWQQARLMDYDWPGNLRELKNVVTRILVLKNMHHDLPSQELHEMLKLSAGEWIKDKQVVQAKEDGGYKEDIPQQKQEEDSKEDQGKGFQTLEEMEKHYLLDVLKSTKGVISGKNGAAAIVGIPRSTLLHKLKKLGIRA